MKKRFLKVGVICLIAASMGLTSCIGSFKLTNNLLSWNNKIGSKFVNELVFCAFWILPVYEVSGLADLLVLNSIEFWSGNNPVAKGKKIVEGNDGKYLVECDGKGYDIKSLNDGSKVRLDFDADNQSWYVTTETESHLLFTFVDDTHVKLPTANSDYQIFETSQEGLYAYRQAIASEMFAKK